MAKAQEVSSAQLLNLYTDTAAEVKVLYNSDHDLSQMERFLRLMSGVHPAHSLSPHPGIVCTIQSELKCKRNLAGFFLATTPSRRVRVTCSWLPSYRIPPFSSEGIGNTKITILLLFHFDIILR